MKKLSLFLLFGNVIFFAVMRWGGLLDEPEVQAQAPLHEEKIRLSSASPAKPPAAAPEAVVPAASAVSVALPVPAASHAMTKNNTVCMEWGNFSGADLVRATTALSALKMDDKLVRRQVVNIIGYWVYIPPGNDKAAISLQSARLKERGIDNFVVPEPGPWLNAISLGVFKTQNAAQRFLDDLRRQKNLSNAQLVENTNKLKATRFVLGGLDTKTRHNMVEIQKDFAESELKEVSCALTK